MDITRDDDGNLTDLSVSTELKEIENGFSVISEAETLRSVSVVNKVNPGAYRITLKSPKSPAGEMGIHLKHTKTGVTVTLTENKKLLHITKVTEDAKNIILHTSSGGTCEIRKDTRKFIADELTAAGAQMDQICLRDPEKCMPRRLDLLLLIQRMTKKIKTFSNTKKKITGCCLMMSRNRSR